MTTTPDPVARAQAVLSDLERTTPESPITSMLRALLAAHAQQAEEIAHLRDDADPPEAPVWYRHEEALAWQAGWVAGHRNRPRWEDDSIEPAKEDC